MYNYFCTPYLFPNQMLFILRKYTNGLNFLKVLNVLKQYKQQFDVTSDSECNPRMYVNNHDSEMPSECEDTSCKP